MGSIPTRMPQKPVTNITFRVLIETTNVPVQAQGFVVPSGCTVNVRGHNGSAAGNSAPVYAGKDRDSALNGPNIAINANTQVPWPCNNTGEICISGNAGDGVQIQIVG